MHDYCLGLLMPIERKSVQPMAAVTAPAQVAVKHQSLLHFIGNAPWSDVAMLAKVGELVLPAITCSGPIEAWIIVKAEGLDAVGDLPDLLLAAVADRHGPARFPSASDIGRKARFTPSLDPPSIPVPQSG